MPCVPRPATRRRSGRADRAVRSACKPSSRSERSVLAAITPATAIAADPDREFEGDKAEQVVDDSTGSGSRVSRDPGRNEAAAPPPAAARGFDIRHGRGGNRRRRRRRRTGARSDVRRIRSHPTPTRDAADVPDANGYRRGRHLRRHQRPHPPRRHRRLSPTPQLHPRAPEALASAPQAKASRPRPPPPPPSAESEARNRHGHTARPHRQRRRTGARPTCCSRRHARASRSATAAGRHATGRPENLASAEPRRHHPHRQPRRLALVDRRRRSAARPPPTPRSPARSTASGTSTPTASPPATPTC